MRLTEASCLLVPEVPSLAHGQGVFHLSKSATKREKARKVYARRRVVRDLHHYLAIERDELVQRTREAGGYTWASGHRVVRSTRQAMLVEGRSRAWTYEGIGYDDRLRLVSVDARGRELGPLWLWLGKAGSR